MWSESLSDIFIATFAITSGFRKITNCGPCKKTTTLNTAIERVKHRNKQTNSTTKHNKSIAQVDWPPQSLDASPFTNV